MQIYTSSWFTPLPLDFVKIGISRGVPRNQPPGYRRIRSLEPGPWFRIVSPEKYHELYMAQLAKLDAAAVLRQIEHLGQAADRVALVCYESPTDPDAWCHRGQVAAWFHDELLLDVYEYGHEHCGCGWNHPMLPRQLGHWPA